MHYITTCLLLTATLSFSNSPSKNFPDKKKQELKPLTFRTAIPPATSYLSLKLLNQQAELNISAEKRLAEEAGAIGLTQTGLSKSTAEKIARCSVAALNDIHSSHSPSNSIKTAGKTFLSEIMLDEIEDLLSIIPCSNTENNVLFQSGKLVTKSIARHCLDKELANVDSWYPAPLKYDLPNLDLDYESDFDSEEEREDLVERINGFTTFFIQRASQKFLAKKLVETTGKDTYLSVHQLPLITAGDIAAATVTGVTSHAFENHKPKETAKLIGKEFTVNKMTAAELGLFKKCWHHGVNNYHAIAAIDKWIHNHQKVVALSEKLLEEFAIPSINENLLEKLLRSISQPRN